MEAATSPLRKTPLHGLFREMGARLVPFAGWEMPVQFTSVIEEHLAVRSAAGLFDVSHMGEIEVRGRGALALVQRLTTNDASRLVPGQAQYSVLSTPRGTFVDDILVYRRGPDDFLLVVNAGNAEKDFAWVARHAEGGAEVTDASGRYAQLALQGPRSEEILRPLTPIDLGSMRSYHFAEGSVRGLPALVSRTGYTGEDGFEIYLAPGGAPALFRALLEAGGSRGLRPCGLGARDTLRLEACLLLYGNDMDEETTPLEAGIPRFVHLDKGSFLGREALLKQRESGVPRRLVAFEMAEPGIARHGHSIVEGGREVGRVTSGTYGPHVRKNIGLGYVPGRLAAPGTRLTVRIRDREAAAVVVPAPFYRRARQGGAA
jgi:aminomethyltransferase